MAKNIPKDFINSLLEKANIVDVIGNYIKLEKKETTIGLDAHSTVKKHHLLVLVKINNFITVLGVAHMVMLLVLLWIIQIKLTQNL